MRVFVALVLLGLASAHLGDLLPGRARGGKMYRDLKARSGDSFVNTTANWYTQLIDHKNPSLGTFQQKYYVDFTYWNPHHGPIYLYISGEGPCTSSPQGILGPLASANKALLIALEHRWYGQSLPGSINSTDDLMTLNIDNVMSDMAAFVSFFEEQLGGGKRVWVSVGGSYAGALSAWFRQKHPESVVASYSSSGVVDAITNFTMFDMIVAQALGTQCANAIRAVTAAMEAAWENPTSRANMLAMFNTPDDFTKEDFAWMMADSGAMGAQYGYKAELCATMLPLTDPLTQFANWTNTHYGTSFGSSCYYSTACLSNQSRWQEWFDDKPWIWQCCSQLAYWQIAYPGSLRSSWITLEYYQGQCAAAFGIPLIANTTAFDVEYGGTDPDTKKVIATNGSDDPWQGAAIRQTLNQLYVERTAQCNGCGHCGDLFLPTPTDPPSLTQQRAFVAQYMGQWGH